MVRNLYQFLHAPSVILILDAYPEPHVRQGPIMRKALRNPVRAFGEKLPVEVRGLADQLPQLRQFPFHDRMVLEYVAHAGGENQQTPVDYRVPRLPGFRIVPREGFSPVLRTEGPAVRIRTPDVESEPLRQGFGVAVPTPRTDLGAAPHYVECSRRPRDDCSSQDSFTSLFCALVEGAGSSPLFVQIL